MVFLFKIMYEPVGTPAKIGEKKPRDIIHAAGYLLTQ